MIATSLTGDDLPEDREPRHINDRDVAFYYNEATGEAEPQRPDGIADYAIGLDMGCKITRSGAHIYFDTDHGKGCTCDREKSHGSYSHTRLRKIEIKNDPHCLRPGQTHDYLCRHPAGYTFSSRVGTRPDHGLKCPVCFEIDLQNSYGRDPFNGGRYFHVRGRDAVYYCEHCGLVKPDTATLEISEKVSQFTEFGGYGVDPVYGWCTDKPQQPRHEDFRVTPQNITYYDYGPRLERKIRQNIIRCVREGNQAVIAAVKAGAERGDRQSWKIAIDFDIGFVPPLRRGTRFGVQLTHRLTEYKILKVLYDHIIGVHFNRTVYDFDPSTGHVIIHKKRGFSDGMLFSELMKAVPKDTGRYTGRDLAFGISEYLCDKAVRSLENHRDESNELSPLVEVRYTDETVPRRYVVLKNI